MNEVAELQNVENVCRLCLSMDEPKSSIFEVEESTVSLVAKIQACLSIQISTTDRLSTLICAQCIKNVNQWHNYKESCLRTQDKLQQWLTNHIQSEPMVVTIKDEPVDLDFYDDNIEVLSESTDDMNTCTTDLVQIENDVTNNSHINDITNDGIENTNKSKEPETPLLVLTKSTKKDLSQTEKDIIEKDIIDKDMSTVSFKSEPDDYDTDCTIEIESVTGSEMLLNPMALAGKEERIMEADSTQKSNAASGSAKKKNRRGPHTHFRGTRVFKQKCVHCQINLHSKYSYAKHMERFHSADFNNSTETLSSQSLSQDEEEIEDVEDELVSMEKDAPLTQVQQNIISQLKTFSCYSCQQTFNDRRSTLAHIRQHMPDLRPYTCIACLMQFPDRLVYKHHCGVSFECAMKIALVIPKQGNEKYFTCNMCLRPLGNRKELLRHLSRHSDKQYEEMMSPSRSPPKLKPMAPLPAPKSETPQKSPTLKSMPGPYKNGDPAHNHVCDLCGMIYRYRPNMLKHRELCLRLLPEVRTSYRCVHCGMTFLVFSKFQSHITVDHRKKEFTCFQCDVKFRSANDFLSHYETHRAEKKQSDSEKDSDCQLISLPDDQNSLKDWNAFDTEINVNKGRANPQKYTCALCSQEFGTRVELSEHRNLHLKVKIYSCVICRSMFSSAGALEIHMKDHGIEDPSEQNANSSCVEYAQIDEDKKDVKMNISLTSDPGTRGNECETCGKIFSNLANLRRHVRNIHKLGKARFPCPNCTRTFKTKALCDTHVQVGHRIPKTLVRCPQCPKSFVYEANLQLHFQTVHNEKSQKLPQVCDICGKSFLEETSLKIHKGWHNRANSRLSMRFMTENNQKPLKEMLKQETSNNIASLPTATKRPARARKSFPNPPPEKPQGNFQCQVCDDKFTDVMQLRTHLWDVHCAHSKPEKSFTGDELQCQLCTNVFPDQETLKVHMQWHKAHPILGEIQKATFSCETCGKIYSSKKVLWKHKKLHKATTVASIKFQSLAKKPLASQFLCTVCRKVFSSNRSLQRHRLRFHNEAQGQRLQQPQQSQSNNGQRNSIDEPKAKKVKLETEDKTENKMSAPANTETSGKKPVMCHVCKKMFPNMSVLYKHKQVMHKQRSLSKPVGKAPTNECIPLPGNNGKVSCNICCKEFTALANLRQHFSHKHKDSQQKYTCHIERCKMTFPSPVTLKNHELTHTNMIFSCNLCDRHVFSRPAMTTHMLTVHNTRYEAEVNKNFHREADLSTYVVRGAVGATCPRCKIKYPNIRAMKIHYFKFHENAD